MLTAPIEGYAALFGRPDLAGDIICRGAFARSLARRRPGDIALLYQHAAEQPVGRWTALREDETGLFARGELLLDATAGREAHALLKGRALSGLSIGFAPVRARQRASQRRNSRPGRTGRELLEIDLWEISIVTFPMMPGARITRVGGATSPAEKIRTATRLITA